MAIEIVVGLPHLSEGPILQRARAMGVPTLISANCLSRWKKRDGWREWSGWRLGTLANARGLASLDLDSGGYVAMSRYNGIPWSVDEYMALAASYPFRRFASLDYCTEEAWPATARKCSTASHGRSAPIATAGCVPPTSVSPTA